MEKSEREVGRMKEKRTKERKNIDTEHRGSVFLRNAGITLPT
jgi:hypothetical protein